MNIIPGSIVCGNNRSNNKKIKLNTQEKNATATQLPTAFNKF